MAIEAQIYTFPLFYCSTVLLLKSCNSFSLLPLALYNCRFVSTNVKISLQIHLFMQNKAKFKKVKFYVNKAMAREYEKMDTWYNRKKQSQTKPNKPKSKKAKMNVNGIITKDYEKMSTWALYENKANFRPKQTQTKPISDLILLKWVIMSENALDIVASATKNAYLMDLNNNRKKEENAAFYSLN